MAARVEVATGYTLCHAVAEVFPTMSHEVVAQAIRRLAAECGTPEVIVQAVLDRLRPSVRLVPKEPARSTRLLGACRIGGLPDLPAGVAWPSYDEEDEYRDEGDPPLPFSFLAQVRLAEVAPFDEEQLLPKVGMIYFFYRPDLDDASRVLFFPTPDLVLRRAELPPELPPDQVYRETEVVPHPEWTVPTWEEPGLEDSLVSEHLDLWHQLEDKVAEVQGLPWHAVSKHRLLGYPQLLQAPSLAEGCRLLLQVDADYNGSGEGNRMMWGDLGTVYYIIAEQDLRAHKFEAASAFWETQ